MRASPLNTRERVSRLCMALVALAAWTGLGVQLWLSGRAGGLHGVLGALAFNTVLTNLLVAAVLSARLVRVSSRSFLASPGTLAATLVYILVVGIVYSLLLRGLWAPTGWQKLADVLMHDVIPVAYLLWWLAFAPKGGLAWSQPAKWLGYPVAYFACALLLGHHTGRYLYPFMDAAQLGLGAVMRNGLVLLALFLALGLLVVGLARLLRPAPAGA